VYCWCSVQQKLGGVKIDWNRVTNVLKYGKGPVIDLAALVS
jgi:hypothetical protein